MEEVTSTYTLKMASKQGTLISFTKDGVTYGGNQKSDSYYSFNENMSVSSLTIGAAIVVIAALFARYRCKRTIVTAEGNLPLDQPVLEA